MKRFLFILLSLVLLTGCGQVGSEETQNNQYPDESGTVCTIVLSDEQITVDGQLASQDPQNGIYIANDIVYYPTGQDFTFGEGTEEDAHTPEEAAAHTVVHITQPGVYQLSGHLSAGQIAIDLGEDAEDDPDAVVSLQLAGVDITCTVAPAIIFYNVYECGDKDNPTETVNLDQVGALVKLKDDTVNRESGSYVARIYEPDSVELSEDGSEVLDSKKLHKYDAAFYSRMSMRINGNTGILEIDAENEGLDSEMHLTINGGNIRIRSGNDGINTNEDGVSVTTINGGSLSITVTGETGEGDGIDSNGWLVINGGTVTTASCGFSGDAGIDSDMGIHINGGTVLATGNMLDQIAESDQTYAVFQFTQPQAGGTLYQLRNEAGDVVLEHQPVNDFSCFIVSSDLLVPGEYNLWCGDTQLSVATGGMGGFRPGGFGGGMMPPDDERPEMSENMPDSMPEFTPDHMPEGIQQFTPENAPDDMPEFVPGTPPQGDPGRFHGESEIKVEGATHFTIQQGGNQFQVISNSNQ